MNTKSHTTIAAPHSLDEESWSVHLPYLVVITNTTDTTLVVIANSRPPHRRPLPLASPCTSSRFTFGPISRKNLVDKSFRITPSNYHISRFYVIRDCSQRHVTNWNHSDHAEHPTPPFGDTYLLDLHSLRSQPHNLYVNRPLQHETVITPIVADASISVGVLWNGAWLSLSSGGDPY